MLPPQVTTNKEKMQVAKRGNGQGSVFRLKNGKWRGAVTVGYYLDETGNSKRKTKSKNFDKKSDAIKWVASPEARQEQKKDITLAELHQLWEPTYYGSESAIRAYTAAWRKYIPLYAVKLSALTIDDLQGCIDGCGGGTETKYNMITLIRMMYKYGIPRHLCPDNLNLADYLKNTGGDHVGKKGIPIDYVDKIPPLFGIVPFAEYVYCQCYLGFRPGELLRLDVKNYDRKNKTIIGGFKTKAGTDRIVTISPKIQPIIAALTADKIAGPLFCDENGKRLSEARYSKLFYTVLDAIGLENPEVTINGRKYRTYTPHSCRHTFASLMKRVDGAGGDKLALIGHTNVQMLSHYEDIDIEGMKKITYNI